MGRIDWNSFISNLIAVVLGIFITFGIQGIIDSREEKANVLSALELVKEELVTNRDNLNEVIGLMGAEKKAAEFILANKGGLARCDADTLLANHTVLCSEFFMTVTEDALELMKSSSLFQKMNDNSLALSIIKAYDFLDANSQSFNTHEKYKINLCEAANTDDVKKAALVSSGPAYIEKFYSSAEAGYFIQAVIEMADNPFISNSLSEIDATISSIDSIIAGK